MNINEKDIYFMKAAIEQAKMAIETGDIPVGAVIVHNDIIIAKAKNEVELQKDSTAHAELIAIKNAVRVISYKHLLNCTLYIHALCTDGIWRKQVPAVEDVG